MALVTTTGNLTVDNTGDVIDETVDQATDDGSIDTVSSKVSYTLSAYLENLTLTGTALNGTGNDEDNIIAGNSAANHLYGMGGNDNLNGGTGADTMYGGAGDDTYTVDNVGDKVSEESTGVGIDDGGNDRVLSSVTFTLGNFIENLSLTGAGNINGTGNNLSNNVYGNAGDNKLTGMDGNDKLKGGAGNDTLIGGAGNDILQGDAGADKFMFSAANVNGTDRIVDFIHGTDQLVFTGADYGFSAGHTLTAAEFTAGTTAAGSHAQFVWDAGSETLYWDHDGAGGDAAVAIAVFTSVGPVIDASDFHFI